MRRVIISVFVYLFAVQLSAAPQQPAAQPAAALKPSCATDLAHCSDVGCGADFDPNLNRLKNLRTTAPATQGTATVETLAQMKDLADPKKAADPTHPKKDEFVKSGSREALKALGEGKKISVVGFLIAAKAELGGESCNCGLHTPAETDNHLVLVSQDTITEFPLPNKPTPTQLGDVFHQREPESITAEFTPRVRAEHHPHFTKEVMDPLIEATKEKALLVRVTGMLMFDSEHFIEHHLARVNNWEIHPVLKMEYCTRGTTCTADRNAGWKSVDDL